MNYEKMTKVELIKELKQIKSNGIHKNNNLIQNALHRSTSYCKLLKTAAISANIANNIKDAFLPVLEEICSYTGWEIGHAYSVSKDDPDLLEPTTFWRLKDYRHFKKFCDVSKKIKFTKGIGLPGRVLVDKKPHWIVDVTKDNNFLSKKIAEAMKIKSGIAFPVMAGTKVVAVLIFFTTKKAKPDHQFLEIMADVGTQLGRVVERMQSKEMQQEYAKALEQKNITLSELLGQIEREKNR